jgi:hypothetical protein
MIETYTIERLKECVSGEVGDSLENGKIPFFPKSPIELPSADDLAFLREELPKQITSKNISYHPETGSIQGLDKGSTIYQKANDVLITHSNRISEFYHDTMPELFRNALIGTSSFRPIQEQGRNLKSHASNELIHFDAGAYGPTNGSRILRFIVNLNPVEDRIWATRGDFPTLFKAYAEEAGLLEKIKKNQLNKTALDQIRSDALNSLIKAGLPLARLLDNSPYDRTMRQFHNFMKDTPGFQNDTQGREELNFPPFSAWTVFTDMVSHACLSGQHAFIWTALIPLENCRYPEMAPINIMRNAA